MLVPSPTAPKHTVARNHRGRENSRNATSANFSTRRTVWRNPGTWRLPYATTALKIAPGFPIDAGIVRHDKGKCTLFYCCVDHYRMLAYKISACEVCIIWRKPTEALKNPSPIAGSRTGKPAIVALKIQLDCSTVHDMTVWANIFVHSHLGCGTDSVFILFCKSHKYFKDAKAMQINRILKISLIWHVKLNQPPKQ